MLLIIAFFIFKWAVQDGQYEDLSSPSHQILFDDQEKSNNHDDRA